MVGLLAVIAVGVASLSIIFPVPRLPRPTGPYAVGTRVYSWTDATRPEPFTSDPGDHRELVVQLWYPTTGQGAPQPYMDSSEPMRVLAKSLHVPAFLLGNVEHAPTHALRDAPAAEGRFPVLMNPAGLSAFRDASLFWIEELASHGYVVLGLDPIWSPIVRWIGLAGPEDFYRGFAEINAYTLVFFDRYLRGKPALLLGEAPGRQPDARLEIRRRRTPISKDRSRI